MQAGRQSDDDGCVLRLLASNTAVTLPDYFMMNSGGIMTTSNMPLKSTPMLSARASSARPDLA